jgi:2-succinyl-6-hydroxy-2,4-cyclohexadiene-1-carboxylate synthase
MRQLFLLHGFAGGSWSYDGVLRTLSRTYDVHRPTLSYHDTGENDVRPNVDFQQEVARLADEIARVARGPVDLVGYSMGGRLALGICVARRDLIRRLMLVSSRRGLDSSEEREKRRAADESWACLAEHVGTEAFLERWWAQPLFRSLSKLPASTLQTELGHRLRHHSAGLAAALRQLSLSQQPSYSSEVRTLDLPIVVLAGALDQKFVALGKHLAAELPQGRCVVVEDAGHHLLLEAPIRVAQLIDEVDEI